MSNTIENHVPEVQSTVIESQEVQQTPPEFALFLFKGFMVLTLLGVLVMGVLVGLLVLFQKDKALKKQLTQYLMRSLYTVTGISLLYSIVVAYVYLTR